MLRGLWATGRPDMQRLEPILGAPLHALLCLLLPDQISLRFWFPDAPGSFGFRRSTTCGSFGKNPWSGVCGFKWDFHLRFNMGTSLVGDFLLSAPFVWSDGRRLS